MKNKLTRYRNGVMLQMIDIDGITYMTEAQWAKKNRAILKRQRNKGIRREWYISRHETAEALFYNEAQTRPYNKKELKHKKTQKVAERKEKIKSLIDNARSWMNKANCLVDDIYYKDEFVKSKYEIAIYDQLEALDEACTALKKAKKMIDKVPKREKTFPELEHLYEKSKENVSVVNRQMIMKTSWQWLAKYHRVVNDDAVPVPFSHRIYDPYVREAEYTNQWYYYRFVDTHEASDEEYDALKKQYINLFGGWVSINLDNTAYDGKKWW